MKSNGSVRGTPFIIVSFLLCSMVAGSGCQFTTIPDQKNQPGPVPSVVEHAPADEIWRALAHSVEATPQQIATPQELAQFVVALVKNGELSQSDAVTFDLAFPKAPSDQRKLTAADAVKLKSLK